jgi:hypothetical protein
VVYLSLWKMMEFVSWNDYPIYKMENKKSVWNRQPMIINHD